jgi:hypothetical protein
MTNTELWVKILNKIEHKVATDFYSIYSMEDALQEVSAPEFSVDSGVTKGCIIPKDSDFVIKWTRDKRENEAEQELEIYQEAVARGIDFLFPQTCFLCEVSGVKFFAQQKVDCSRYDLDEKAYTKYKKITKTVKAEIFQKAQKGFYNYSWRSIDNLWLSMIISLYGKKITLKLEQFTVDFKINDLHNGNIGFINNRPVLLDFCGYHR